MTVADAAISDEQVAAHLRANPDFLLRYPELAACLAAPPRENSEGRVADLQQYMIDRLRQELDEVKGCAEHLIGTQRSNMSLQARIHDAVLTVLASGSLADLTEALSGLSEPLEVDVITLCLETSDEVRPEIAASGVLRLPRGTCAAIFGDRDTVLRGQASGDEGMFGSLAPLVRSYALARLPAGQRRPPGLLALGSRDERTFHHGQGTELLLFFTRVVEYAVQRWVD